MSDELADLSYDMEFATVTLPVTTFLFTVDQIAYMLDADINYVKRNLLWYNNRDFGRKPRAKILAVNISDREDRPEWRIPEKEFTRWLRIKNIHFVNMRHV